MFGWEEIEKWEGSEGGVVLPKNKGPLMEQNFVFVPVNSSKSKHWILLIVMPEKRVLFLFG